MPNDQRLAQFETMVMPHLDAAYNLARWLVRNPHDAEDRVQEAYLRAFRYFNNLRADDARAWLLTIVRNTCYSWLKKQSRERYNDSYDESETALPAEAEDTNPEILLSRMRDSQQVNACIDLLPTEFREVIVLRELEGFSYREIAAILDVPLGTVMSRLSRARNGLQQLVTNTHHEG